MTDNMTNRLYPYRSSQVSGHGWRLFRKWYWEVATQNGIKSGHCFKRKNAYKKAGMEA